MLLSWPNVLLIICCRCWKRAQEQHLAGAIAVCSWLGLRVWGGRLLPCGPRRGPSAAPWVWAPRKVFVLTALGFTEHHSSGRLPRWVQRVKPPNSSCLSLVSSSRGWGRDVSFLLGVVQFHVQCGSSCRPCPNPGEGVCSYTACFCFCPKSQRPRSTCPFCGGCSYFKPLNRKQSRPLKV